ncbi:putative Histidine kinase [Candidatus Terasakiella magnetica]|uniref:histidine kinase n=1 Tax=Candidatus Terasakiella magnetica TaxID=1867952 RepID=A0A1C3RDJ6_9PROT|nr:PAS-domain containing protein [Candidatus Terasakiella magnetica]SCA55335.1 putative Histidine kinase [Candidatus Terasakiella magnetica]
MSDYTGFKELTPETMLIVQALDQLDQGFSIFDADLKLCLFNKHFQSLFKYPDDFLQIGMPIEKIIRYNLEHSKHPHAKEELLLKQRLEHIKEKTTENIIRMRPNGIVVSIATAPLPNGGIVATYKDVTETYNAKKELEKREAQFRGYLELSPVGATLVDLNGNIQYANTRLMKMFGYSLEEINDVSVLDFYANPDSRVELLASLQANQGPATFRFLGKKKDGSTFPMVLTSQIVELDGSKKIFSWLIDISDITEATKTIQHLSEQNKLILSAAGAGILGVDNHNIIQFINPAAAQLLGYGTDELKNKSLFNLIDDEEVLPDQYIDDPYIAESEIRCKSDRKIPVKFTISPIKNEEGTSGKVFVFDDISDRIAAEEVLRQAMKDIEATSQAKSHFLSTMSHELRTPLNAILGFAQILSGNSEKNLTGQQLTFVDHMFKAGEHLLKLINEAIDIAAIESGKVSLSMQSIEVTEVFKLCINQNLEFAEKNDVRLNIKSTTKEKLYVIADQARLQQILMHLISNGIKYNRKDGQVSLECERTDNDKIRIKVSDTGIGISNSEQLDIFEPFNRLDIHTKEIEGTGLGLTICRHLTQLMGGQIGYTTTKNKGSCFWISLPCSDENTPLIIKDI